MSNVALASITWLAFVVHLGIGIAARRRPANVSLLPLLNLVVALAVLAYWVPRWIGYVSRDIQWYATDQLVPLYAVLVCALAVASLTGRVTTGVPHWVVFGIDTLALLGAALLFTLFRINRLS